MKKNKSLTEGIYFWVKLIQSSQDKKRDFSTPNIRLENNLVNMNNINSNKQARNPNFTPDNFETAYKSSTHKAESPNIHPSPIPQMIPVHPQIQPCPFQIPYSPHIGLAGQMYPNIFPGFQQVPMIPHMIPNQIVVPPPVPQPVYIFYPTPKAPLSDNGVKEDENTEEVLSQSADKPKAEFQNTIHNQVPNFDDDDDPIEIELTPPKLKHAYSSAAIITKSDLNKLDRIAKPVHIDPNDERPIHPSAGNNPLSSGLSTIYERSKQTKDNRKDFLKKKKVYDPKESIKKDKVTKTKQQTKKPAKSPTKTAKQQAPKLKTNTGPQGSFVNMDHKAKVEKISQLLKMNRKI